MNLREAAQAALASMDQMLNMGEWYCARERADALRAALAENERDWSLLEATQESLREHMAEIKTLRDAMEQADKPKTIAEWWTEKQTASGEPDMRHPKIQALIGAKARREIELQLVEQLLDDPGCDLSAMDMEYWHGLHDKLREKLTAATAQPAPVPLTDEQIDQITAEQWGRGLGAPYAAYRAYARAVEARCGIVPAPATDKEQQ
jgi:hypothetical protein